MIIYDHRENRSGIPAKLDENDIETLDALLRLGDFLIIHPDDYKDYMRTHVTVIPNPNNSDIVLTEEQMLHYKEVLEEFKRNIEDLILLLIEAKRGKDFPESIRTRHMNDQLWRQSKDYHASVLIIEGSLEEACEGSGINYKQARYAIDSAIMKRALEGKQGNISVITTKDQAETIEHLINFDKYMSETKSIIRKDKTVHTVSKKDIERNLQSTVSTFPGVDDIKAKAILGIYPSLKDIVTSTVEDLEVVDGLANKSSTTLFDYFNYIIPILELEDE